MGLIAAGAIGGIGSIIGSIVGGNASEKAAQQQAAAQQQGLNFQEQVWNQQQQNQQPFLQAGQQSLSTLMSGLQNGTLGPGSVGSAPTAPGIQGTAPGAFTAPTAAQAAQTPGYQFLQQQQDQGIMRAAAASGGVGGGTLKSLGRFDTNLANTTYGDTFNRALQTYGAGLQGYQTANNVAQQNYAGQLQGYGENLYAQNQGFNQLLAPVQIGEGATQNLNATGSQVAQSVGQLMGNIGNAQAAGTVGQANAINSGIGGFTGGLSQGLLLNQLGLGNNNASTPNVSSTFNPISQQPDPWAVSGGPG